MDSIRDREKIDSDFNSDLSSNLDDSVKQQTTMTALGKTKTFVGLDREEWIFIALSSVNIVLAIIFTIVAIILKTSTPDFAFAIIVLINAAFCIFYAIHGILREREFEVYAYIAAITVVFVYLVINLIVALTSSNVKKNTKFYVKLARIITFVLFAPMNVYYGLKVARDFGYLEFRTVGAAVPLQKIYRKAGIFSCLLKFDFQLALSLAVLVIYSPQKPTEAEKIFVGVGVPFQLLWSVLGWFTMRKEKKLPAVVFIALSIAEPACLVYWFYKVIRNWDELASGNSKSLVYSYVVVAILSLVIRVLVIVALKFVVDNFGKGLRESVYNLPESDEQSLLARKRDTAKCCGIVWCGPFG